MGGLPGIMDKRWLPGDAETMYRWTSAIRVCLIGRRGGTVLGLGTGGSVRVTVVFNERQGCMCWGRFVGGDCFVRTAQWVNAFTVLELTLLLVRACFY